MDRDSPALSPGKEQRWVRIARGLLVGLPLVYLLLFYFYPLGSIIGLAFASGDGVITSLVERLARQLDVIWFTTWQAGLSTLLTLLVGLPGAYAFARYSFPGKSLLNALITVPFVLPTVVVAVALTALLGRQGWLNLTLMRILGLDSPPLQFQGTLAAIMVAHVFYNAVLVVRMVGTQWANLDPKLTEAARTLHGSRWRAFLEITLPLLSPSLGAAALLTFVFCFTSFGVVLILGGGRYATLEVEIYYRTIYLPDLPLAASLALIQIIATFGLMQIYTQIQARMSAPQELRSRRVTQRRPISRSEWLLLGSSLLPLSLLLLTPLAALGIRSMTIGEGAGLAHYLALFENPRGSIFYVPPIAAVRNSVLLAMATAALALLLGIAVSSAIVGGSRNNRRDSPRGSPLARLIDPLIMLPLGTSAVTLGLGYVIALDEPPLNLRTSPVLVVLAHTLVALPFVVRSLLPALRSIHPRLREAATMLGATPWQVWREIDLPIAARAVGVGAVFAFTISMGEFGATSLIARPQLPTMPVAIYRLLGQPGVSNYGQALAMSTLLMLVCIVGFAVIDRFRVGEF